VASPLPCFHFRAALPFSNRRFLNALPPPCLPSLYYIHAMRHLERLMHLFEFRTVSSPDPQFVRSGSVFPPSGRASPLPSSKIPSSDFYHEPECSPFFHLPPLLAVHSPSPGRPFLAQDAFFITLMSSFFLSWFELSLPRSSPFPFRSASTAPCVTLPTFPPAPPTKDRAGPPPSILPSPLKPRRGPLTKLRRKALSEVLKNSLPVLRKPCLAQLSR